MVIIKLKHQVQTPPKQKQLLVLPLYQVGDFAILSIGTGMGHVLRRVVLCHYSCEPKEKKGTAFLVPCRDPRGQGRALVTPFILSSSHLLLIQNHHRVGPRTLQIIQAQP